MPICLSCQQNQVYSDVCRECGRCTYCIRSANNYTRFHDEIPICSECLSDRDQHICQGCETLVDHLECEHCETCSRCTDCLHCHYCEERVDFVCGQCGYCEDCTSLGQCGNGYCESCCERYCECQSIIRPYGDRRYPRPIPRELPDDDVWLGVELEYNDPLGNREDCAYAIHDEASEWIILKEDASITGFEIVTGPMVLSAHKDGRWEAVFRILERHGMAISNGTGFHVHLSKVRFTDRRHKLAFASFLNWQHPTLNRLIGRPENNYWRRLSSVEDVEQSIDRQPDRFIATNFLRDSTIEVRCFKSTKRLHNLYRRLELTHAVWALTRQESVDGHNVRDFARLVDFVRENADTYSSLHNFLIKNGY